MRHIPFVPCLIVQTFGLVPHCRGGSSSCTPCMNDSLEVKVLFTSRWGEVIAKRKGVIARWGLKEAWSKDASRWTRTGYEAYGIGRAGN